MCPPGLAHASGGLQELPHATESGSRVIPPHATLVGHGVQTRSRAPAGPQRALTSLLASPGTKARSRLPREQDPALSQQPFLWQTPPLCPIPLSAP